MTRAADLPRRGLRREEAAAYVGVSPTTFDRWIAAGLMPKGKKIGDVVVWDRFRLDTSSPEQPAAPLILRIARKENRWDAK